MTTSRIIPLASLALGALSGCGLGLTALNTEPDTGTLTDGGFTDGFDGADGTDGADGADGTDGADGADGTDGADGKTELWPG